MFIVKKFHDLFAVTTNEFLEAAKSGNLRKVRKFIASVDKKELNAINNNGNTALINATSINYDPNSPGIKKSLAVVTTLIEAGVDVNLTNKDNMSALYYAAKYGRSDLVDILLKAKAKVYVPALEHAINSHCLSTVKSLAREFNLRTLPNASNLLWIAIKNIEMRLESVNEAIRTMNVAEAFGIDTSKVNYTCQLVRNSCDSYRQVIEFLVTEGVDIEGPVNGLQITVINLTRESRLRKFLEDLRDKQKNQMTSPKKIQTMLQSSTPTISSPVADSNSKALEKKPFEVTQPEQSSSYEIESPTSICYV